MSVKIKNDGKEKYQSFTALLALDEGDGCSHWSLDVTAYGKSKSQALANLRVAADQLSQRVEYEMRKTDEELTADGGETYQGHS